MVVVVRVVKSGRFFRWGRLEMRFKIRRLSTDGSKERNNENSLTIVEWINDLLSVGYRECVRHSNRRR